MDSNGPSFIGRYFIYMDNNATYYIRKPIRITSDYGLRLDDDNELTTIASCLWSINYLHEIEYLDCTFPCLIYYLIFRYVKLFYFTFLSKLSFKSTGAKILENSSFL